MKGLYPTVWAEILKVRKSKIFIITAMVSAKASMFKDDWSSFFGLLIMIILTLGTIGFGTITAWVFGREYSDRVVQDLLALPVPQYSIVLSKFITIIAWSFLLSLILFFSGILTGFLVNIANWSIIIAYHYFIIFLITSFFTMLLCTPVALVASFARGYLAPLGFVIGTLIVTQIMFVGILISLPTSHGPFQPFIVEFQVLVHQILI